MYKSNVLKQQFNLESCPNQFQSQWLDWLIDEAHKQGMEVHAYFEKGIKVDENSPIFDRAVEERWIVAGIDRTYEKVDHYLLDVSVPEIAQFMTDIVVEFVKKYPTIDAVQWDDYLGYDVELPGKLDRSPKLTNFVQTMIKAMKQANPTVSFDLCHHNPFWAKTRFSADWERWGVDRAFIQVYRNDNFEDDLVYVYNHDGIAITDEQLNYLPQLVADNQVQSILLFPLSVQPEELAANYNQIISSPTR